jgi:AraC-like DNA-binding protein
MKTLGYASIPAVRQYVRFAQDQNLDVIAALRAADIDVKCLDQTEERVSSEQFQAFVLNLVEQSQDPLLGLKSGAYVQPGSYSVLGYIVMSCATLGEAIARIAPYEKLVGDMGVTTLESVPPNLLLRWHCAYPNPRVRAQMTDNVLASWVNYARWLSDDPAGPLEVRLEHGLSDPALRQEYEKVFGCPVRFDQPLNGILISPDLLHKPLRQPDQLLRRTLEDHAQTQIAALAEDDVQVVIRVKNMIHYLLRAGISRMDSVADELQMTTRTLQRRLKVHDLTYQQLLDEVRQELAQDYLTNTQLPLMDIALRLGFAETRSFHRSFKTWTGVTPGDYRDGNGRS